MNGPTQFFMRCYYFKFHFLSVSIMHNGVPCEAMFYCKSLAPASVFAHKRVIFLKQGENMTLETKHSCVASTTVLSPDTHWDVSFHMLLSVTTAFECFLAHFIVLFHFLWFLSHVFATVAIPSDISSLNVVIHCEALSFFSFNYKRFKYR